ncbi:hypothetical protein ACFE04_001179 [Oxalis oulophora]
MEKGNFTELLQLNNLFSNSNNNYIKWEQLVGRQQIYQNNNDGCRDALWLNFEDLAILEAFEERKTRRTKQGQGRDSHLRCSSSRSGQSLITDSRVSLEIPTCVKDKLFI